MFILELLKLLGYMAIIWGLNQMMPPHSSDITHKNLYDSLVQESYQSHLDQLSEPAVVLIDDGVADSTGFGGTIECPLSMPDSLQ